jgi:hypothetical protein
VRAVAQDASASNASAEDFFYREDWFGEPWRKPEAAVLIRGNAESSIVWYAWMPQATDASGILPRLFSSKRQVEPAVGPMGSEIPVLRKGEYLTT